MKRGWNAERGAFVQQLDGEALDASSLLMPLVFFVSPARSRILRTAMDAINRPPKDGGLVSMVWCFVTTSRKLTNGFDRDRGYAEISARSGLCKL